MDIDIIANNGIIVGCINAGYQGENNALILNFTIPAEYSDGDIYLDWQLPNGQKTQTAALIGNSFTVPHELLTSSGNGKMDVVYKKSDVKKVIAQYRVTITAAVDADSTMTLEYQDVIQDHESRITAVESGKADAVHAHTVSQISDFPSLLTLGETSTTAYRGDHGKTAYDHSQATGNPHSTTASQISITDQGGYFAATNTETALAEAGLILKRLQNPCISVTLTGAVTTITYTQCDDGLALNAKVMLIDIRVPSGSNIPTGTAGYIFAQFNNVTTGYFEYGYPTDNRLGALVGRLRNQRGFGQTRVVMYGNYANVSCVSGDNDGTTSIKGTYLFDTPDLGAASISRIHLYSGTGHTIPIGTRINVWEVRA